MAFSYIGNYPKNRETNWSDSLQGVTHDEEHWYFTQKTKIIKFHVSTRLSHNTDASVEVAHMPKSLERYGGDHFGDPDFIRFNRKGYLFIPVENEEGVNRIGNAPRIAVFSTDGGLKFIGFYPLPQQNKRQKTARAGWCAIHPQTRILYSSHNRIDSRYPVYMYKVDYRRIGQERNRDILTTAGRFELKDSRGNPYIVSRYLQGGTFSPDGRLILLNGRASNDTPAREGGIHIFDKNGRIVERSILGRSRRIKFRYQYEPGFPNYQEPEGITYWNLARRQSLPSKKLKGQLHAILLNKQAGKDNYWFKHYSEH
ncbi:hypothetical protein OOZ15_18060 [Galbibacter sp. EGI 63066]|uniref:hypothetical protein n=1 Tax=Galbibacter sp. EGI 63066 TaxID=2993559 RepID=UPI002248EFF9|nr:hypothetical protein [Galbibacter sp. EGI 63066]MCX2681865.1 hypothetical protein [Galbibacter sp. EGI 63066]